MRALRHPVTQFLGAGLLLLTGVIVVSSVLISRAAEQEALADARATTWVLGHSVAEPAIPRGLAHGDLGAVDKFDRRVGQRLLNGDVVRIKIWAPDGTVVYSDATQLIGQRFDLEAEELEVLDDGGTDAELSDLDEPENRFEQGGDELVEVYTGIESPEGRPLLFEAYFTADDIAQRKQEVFAPFQRIAVGALVLLLALAVPFVWVLARRLTKAAGEREQLLQRSMDASAAERRRIARDLHDSVVQDLAGSTFTVAALARQETTPPETRQDLEEVAASMRDSQRALRSLLVEINPPHLGPAGLPAALEDLTAPAAAAGLRTKVSVTGVDGASDDSLALVWRAAQEAVRNTIRHAGATTLGVSVDGTGGDLVLEVADDGTGFDPETPAPEGHYGLRGMASLVEDGGGRLAVRSAPGAGTTVRVEVPR